MASVKMSVGASSDACARRGNAVPPLDAIAATPSRARATPTIAPTVASKALSVRSWRTRRLRLAPRAVRMPISRSLAVARTIIRLATFEHAINNTRPTAPINNTRAGRTAPTRSSRTGRISMAKLKFV